MPGPTRLSIPNSISIDTAIFAQLTAIGPYTLEEINRFTSLDLHSADISIILINMICDIISHSTAACCIASQVDISSNENA